MYEQVWNSGGWNSLIRCLRHPVPGPQARLTGYRMPAKKTRDHFDGLVGCIRCENVARVRDQSDP